MKLSIIIPCYNVELYIERCILSCAMQSPYISTDYEIVIIDDGSIDGSMRIAEDIQKKYPHLIRLHSQKNQGLSIARNVGLELARGKYVWFVDSDDWIEPNCLQQIIPLLDNEEVDLLQLQYRLAYDDSLLNCQVKRYWFEGILTGKEVMRRGGLPAPAQFTIARKHFLEENDVKFMAGIYHEDVEFKPRATYLASKIVCLDKICYNYYQRLSGSITSNFKMKNAVDIITVANSLYLFAQSVPSNERFYFYYTLSMNMNSLFYECKKLGSSDFQKIKQMLYNQRNIYKAMILSRNLKYMFEGIFLLLNVDLGLWIYRILK